MNDPRFKNYLLQGPIPVLVFQTETRSRRLRSNSQNNMSSQTPNFQTPPPAVENAIVSFPTPTILLVTLNRPRALNCINMAGHWQLHALFEWMDNEPSLRCGIITGTGRAFCAGADLKEWNSQAASSDPSKARIMPMSGFGGLSRRSGRKPIIAAVNGICFGGGCEMTINCDIVIASSNATFALPEVKRGVVAIAGALTRLVRTVGKQRAMEMALTGRTLGAAEAREWGLVNAVVEGEAGEVVRKAVEMAELVAENSPDSVIVSREGIKMGWEGVGVEEGTRKIAEEWYPKMQDGENLAEGLKAFVEKRKPRWVPSKL